MTSRLERVAALSQADRRMVVGITGTRTITRTMQKLRFKNFLDYFISPYLIVTDRFIVGGATGADLLFSDWLLQQSIQRTLIWIVPKTIKDQSEEVLSFYLEHKDRILLRELEDPNFPKSEAYRNRNETLVNLSDLVIGFPSNSTNKKTGTWMTLNYAEKMDTPRLIVPTEQFIGK